MEYFVAETAADLRPLDVIQEGIFIRSLTTAGGLLLAWEIADLTVVDEPVGDTTYKAPQWGPLLDWKPKFPMTVIRGAAPPAGVEEKLS